jgi:16S rRNA (uracil1498-N3)-methyltransferase
VIWNAKSPQGSKGWPLSHSCLAFSAAYFDAQFTGHNAVMNRIMRAMNVILIQPNEWGSQALQGQVTLSGRRLQHIASVLQPSAGDQLRVGIVNGMLGMATVAKLSSSEVVLNVSLNTPPPAPLPVTLLLALPRPKVLQRVLQCCATMGVKQIYLINSYRVEKSYWQTPHLQPTAIENALLLGLEQGRDTNLPEVHLRKRFKPFAEDELPALCQGKPAWTAHPMPNSAACPQQVTEDSVLAIGPEGGFIPYEVDKLAEAGFQTITLGPRILKVETAIPALLAKLFM